MDRAFRRHHCHIERVIQLLKRKRFCDDRLEAVVTEIGHHGILCVAARDDCSDSRIELVEELHCLAAADPVPTVTQDLEATVCWFAERPLAAGDRLLVQHTTRVARAVVTELVDRLDVIDLSRVSAPASLALNDLGTIRLSTATGLAIDPYAASRATGSLLLVDEVTNATVGAALVVTAF